MSNRFQILYQKTEFNSSKICQLSGIYKCCKCKRNNNINTTLVNTSVQSCAFL